MDESGSDHVWPTRLPRRTLLKGAVLGASSALFAIGLSMGRKEVTDVAIGLANDYSRVNSAQIFRDVAVARMYSPEHISPINNLSELHTYLDSRMKNADLWRGHPPASVRVLAVNRNTGDRIDFSFGQPVDTYPVASVAKVPIVLTALQMGERAGRQFVTPDLAMRALRFSDNEALDEIAKQIPPHYSASFDQYKALMELQGIKVQSTSVPLRVKIEDVMAFFDRNPVLPDELAAPLTSSASHSELTFRVPDIYEAFVRKTVRRIPLQLKLGLLSAPLNEQGGSELTHVGYFTRIGEYDMVAHAAGGDYAAVTAMLHANAGLIRCAYTPILI